jgi:putative hydrolase of the HAD superfamily
MPFKAITFDLDDTLYDNFPVIAHLETETLQWLSERHPKTATQPIEWWRQLKLDIARQQPLITHDVTKWRFTQLYTGFCHLGYHDSEALQAAQETIEHVLTLRNNINVPTVTHTVLQQLAAQFPLIAITNGNADPQRFGLGHYFAQVYRAGPDGKMKPSGQMFEQAREFLSLPSHQILHVGDHLRSDIQGAKDAGFSACWINETKQDMRLLTNASILPDVEITQLEQLLKLF